VKLPFWKTVQLYLWVARKQWICSPIFQKVLFLGLNLIGSPCPCFQGLPSNSSCFWKHIEVFAFTDPKIENRCLLQLYWPSVIRVFQVKGLPAQAVTEYRLYHLRYTKLIFYMMVIAEIFLIGNAAVGSYPELGLGYKNCPSWRAQ